MVTSAGVVGYLLLGFGLLDALITVTTVGFREVEPFSTAEKIRDQSRTRTVDPGRSDRDRDRNADLETLERLVTGAQSQGAQ